MNWLRKFMYGRYGVDQISIILMIISLILSLIGRISSISLFGILSYIPLIFGVYRILSKDTRKRSMENYRFSMMMSPIYSRFKNLQRRIKERKTHRFFKCPNCKTTVRVPKGKGKIIITCPKCKEKFEERT